MALKLEQLVIDDIGPVSLSLDAGQWLLLAGGNGSGKTMLCHALAGWVPQLTPRSFSGQASWLQQPLLTEVPLNTEIQLLQSSPQWSGCAFTVADEIAFGPANLGLSNQQILQRLNASMTLCDCHHLAERHPAELSGGEAQRVALACALAMEPTLLIVDQAFSRLTPAAHQHLLRQLKRLLPDMTVVLAEMALQPTLPLVDKVALMDTGRLQAFGPPTELLPLLLTQLLCSDAWQALDNALTTVKPQWLPLSDQQLLQWFKEHPNAID